MTDFEPPSFSLGLDFDLDSEPQYEVHPHPNPDPFLPQPQPSSSAVLQHDDDDDFEACPTGPAQDSSVIDPPPTFKRLRRGLTLPPRKSVPEVDCSNLDEDIEEFSSQEEDIPKGTNSATQSHSFASTSKLPLHRLGVFQSTYEKNSRNNNNKFPNSSSSANTAPKIIGSPLRRFQLIDSDSDSDFETPKNSNKEDLWKDFSFEKSYDIPTPAFDKACEEYFSSVKINNQTQFQPQTQVQTKYNNQTQTQVQTKISECFQINNQNKRDPLVPANRYFFHEDPRIQKLVRDRLPHFSPLGMTINQGFQQHDVSVIDYTSQFGQGESSKQASKRPKADSNSTRGRKNSKNTRGKEKIEETENNWVNPKSCGNIPKDAGQRRVQAVGKSAGHWFTDSNGRKVYVNANGKEMSGRDAYKNYKKESGGFKAKKKTATKRKSGAKKK